MEEHKKWESYGNGNENRMSLGHILEMKGQDCSVWVGECGEGERRQR